MNKFYCFLFLLCNFYFSQAQSDIICAGERLVDEVFNNVKITDGVVYGTGTDVLGQSFDLLMDVYEPEGDTAERRPVVVMAHGGSFITGNRKNDFMVNACTDLAKRGYVTASIEYTLWPFATLGLPDSTDLIQVIISSLADMKTAVRYFKKDGQNENNYRVNPTSIVAGGYSAGAIIACHQGIMDSSDEIDLFVNTEIENQGGFGNLGNNPEIDDEVIAVINFSGSIYNLDYIDENSVPIHSAHGTADGTVPYAFGLTGGIMTSNGSSLIDKRYEDLGLESELYTFEGGGHTDVYFQPQFQAAFDEMLDGLYPWLKDKVCTVLSSQEELAIVQSAIYPNPVDDWLNMELETNGEAYSFKLYNQLGGLVYVENNIRSNTRQVDVSNLSEGMYIFKVEFEDTFAPIVQRIIVRH